MRKSTVLIRCVSSFTQTNNILLYLFILGEKVPHFVEVDEALRQENQIPFLILQPLRPLHYARRYIVGVSHFKNLDGEEIVPSSNFLCLREENTTSDCPSSQAFLTKKQRIQQEVIEPLITIGMQRYIIESPVKTERIGSMQDLARFNHVSYFIW